MWVYLLWIVVIVVLWSVAYAAMHGAPWVPTHRRSISRLVRLLDLKPGERFVELGCGDARACRALERAYPQAKIDGVELSMLQFGVGWMMNRVTGSRVKLWWRNAFKHPLHEYDAVYLFLMPTTYEKIRPKLEAELKPGARVVSYVWPILGWEPERVEEAEGSPKLFLYRVGK